MLPDPALRSPIRENTAERFGYEWNHFRDFNFDEEAASLKTWFQPRRLDDLAGLNVLEAGCGMGRHATIATHYGVHALVGMDLGNAVEAAFENTRHLPAVCIVQGDIYYPPLNAQGIRRGIFTGSLAPPARSRSRFQDPRGHGARTTAGFRSGCTAAKEMAG